MATKRALEVGWRRRHARGRLYVLLDELIKGPPLNATWLKVQALERAAIAVGEERERGRQAKRKGLRR